MQRDCAPRDETRWLSWSLGNARLRLHRRLQSVARCPRLRAVHWTSDPHHPLSKEDLLNHIERDDRDGIELTMHAMDGHHCWKSTVSLLENIVSDKNLGEKL